MKLHFDTRSDEPEIMDDFSIGGPLIEQTLREIATINKWLGGDNVTLSAIKKLVKNGQKHHYTIVDVGCGGGEILRLIAKWARKENISLHLIGIDANPHVVTYAQKMSTGYPEIEYRALDILSPGFRQIKCDIITATLFVHHFSNKQLVDILNRFSSQAEVGIVINDLHRHWFAYHSIDWITRFFSRSSMVQNDARLSVLRAFSKKELNQIFKEAAIRHYSIQWMWAFRWQVIIKSQG